MKKDRLVIKGYIKGHAVKIEMGEVVVSGEDILKINLDDTVRIKDGLLKGRLGVVIAIEEDNCLSYGIELDNFHEKAHDLEGRTTYGYGYWLCSDEIEVLDEEFYEEDEDDCNGELDCKLCPYSEDCGMLSEDDEEEILLEDTRSDSIEDLEIGDIVKILEGGQIGGKLARITNKEEIIEKTGTYRYKITLIDSDFIDKYFIKALQRVSWRIEELEFVARYSMFVTEQNDGREVVIIIDYPKITTIMSIDNMSFKGESKCNIKEDEFDIEKGMEIAMTRLSIQISEYNLKKLTK